MNPWGENDLLCLLSGKGRNDSFNRFQWVFRNQSLNAKKLPRTENGDDEWVWLEKNFSSFGLKFDLEDCTKRTITEQFYDQNFFPIRKKKP